MECHSIGQDSGLIYAYNVIYLQLKAGSKAGTVFSFGIHKENVERKHCIPLKA